MHTIQASCQQGNLSSHIWWPTDATPCLCTKYSFTPKANAANNNSTIYSSYMLLTHGVLVRRPRYGWPGLSDRFRHMLFTPTGGTRYFESMQKPLDATHRYRYAIFGVTPICSLLLSRHCFGAISSSANAYFALFSVWYRWHIAELLSTIDFIYAWFPNAEAFNMCGGVLSLCSCAYVVF